MASAAERIIEAMTAALNAPADKPLPTVRQRPRPIAVDNPDGTSGIDAMLLYSVKEDAEMRSATLVNRTRHVRIEIPVTGPPPLDQAADSLYLFVMNTLYSDEAFTSMAVEDNEQKTFFMEEVGLIWETVSTYEDVSVCALELKVSFATTIDPSVRV